MKGTRVGPEWTFARSRGLHECDRRYWYEALLAPQGVADTAPAAARWARRLDAAWSFEELVTDVVRRAIVGDLVDHWEGRSGTPEPEAARETLRQYWRESRARWGSFDGLADSPPPRRYRPIREILYGNDDPELLRTLAEDASSALVGWTESETRRAWTNVAPDAVKWLLDPAASAAIPGLAIGPGRVREAPLLVCRLETGQLEIGDVHWQRNEDPVPPGRRAVHALWAAGALHVEPEQFAFRTLVLPRAREEAGAIAAGDVLAVRDRIVRDTDAMLQHAASANGPDAETASRFARRDAEPICAPCRFRQLCPTRDTEEFPWTE